MKNFIDPKVDCVFKAILGSNKHKNLLLSFLNATLKQQLTNPITEITIENPYNDKQQLDAKLSIVDIKATDNHGRIFQIEIQLSSPRHLSARMLHTWSAIHNKQIIQGDDYIQIRPTISIWLLTNSLILEPQEDGLVEGFRYHFEAYDRVRRVRLSDQFSVHVIELNKWTKPCRLQAIDYWLYFLCNAGKWKSLPQDAMIPELEEAMKVLETFSEQEKSYYSYLARKDALMDQRSKDLALEDELNKRVIAESKVLEQQGELAAKDDELAAKDDELAAKDDEIARLKALLADVDK